MIRFCPIKEKFPPNIVIYIKSAFSVQKFADDHGIPLFEVSAKDGTNVELAIAHTVARIWKAMTKQDKLLLSS